MHSPEGTTVSYVAVAKGMGLFSRSFAVTHLFVHRFDSDVEPSQREPACAVSIMLISSDVKRGQNLEAEAKAPRPELRGRGQDYEAEAETKSNYEKSTK